MTVVLWAFLGIVAGALGFQFGRFRSWTIFLIGITSVAAARFLVGPFEASAAIIGVVAGGLASATLRSQGTDDHVGLAAFASAIVVLPIEVGAVVLLMRLTQLMRLGERLTLFAIGAGCAFALLRGQPFPYLVAAIGSLAILIAFKLHGARDTAPPDRV